MIINLHGKLGLIYGKKHKFKVKNTKEALDALCGSFPGFKSQIKRLTQKGVVYKAVMNKKNVCKEVYSYYEKCDEIDVVPSVFGAGPGFLLVGGLGAVGLGAGVGGAFGQMLVYLGISLILQGIVALLFPFETPSGEAVAPIQTESYLFNNSDNNAVQGFIIPIVYGHLRVGSSVVSTNIEAIDISKG